MPLILEQTNFLGIDIGETQVRIIQLKKEESEDETDHYSLVAAGSVNLPTELKEKTESEASHILGEKISKLLKEIGIVTDNAVLSLPETEVYTRVLELDKGSKESMTAAIESEAESYIPFPINEIQLDWQPLEELTEENGEEKVRCLLVGAPLSIINHYLDIVTSAGLKPIAIETDTIANNRSITHETADRGTIAILDIGTQKTSLAISSNGIIHLTHNIPIGSYHITTAISKDLSITFPEAEKLKNGISNLDEVQRDMILNSYTSIIDSISSDIKRTINFYQSKNDSRVVSHMYITGRGSKLFQIENQFKTNLGIDIIHSNPWNNINTKGNLTRDQLLDMSSGFSVALGLAMRSES